MNKIIEFENEELNDLKSTFKLLQPEEGFSYGILGKILLCFFNKDYQIKELFKTIESISESLFSVADSYVVTDDDTIDLSEIIAQLVKDSILIKRKTNSNKFINIKYFLNEKSDS